MSVIAQQVSSRSILSLQWQGGTHAGPRKPITQSANVITGASIRYVRRRVET